jgi:hypothetical protein
MRVKKHVNDEIYYTHKVLGFTHIYVNTEDHLSYISSQNLRHHLDANLRLIICLIKPVLDAFQSGPNV